MAPSSGGERSDREVLSTHNYVLAGMCDVLCTFQTNLMQSPQSSVQELSSFIFPLWCMTNPCIIFSRTRCRTAHPRRGRMGTGCCVTCSELRSAGSSCWCSPCSGWNRHNSLRPHPGGSISEATTAWHYVGALTVCSFLTRDSSNLCSL